MRLLFVAAVAMAASAQAAPFADPTRPPSASEPGAGVRDEGPRLESVLIAPDRRIAVISGQQVVVGTKAAGGEVVKISESEVVIRGPDGLHTLRLIPEMRQASTGQKRGKTP